MHNQKIIVTDHCKEFVELFIPKNWINKYEIIDTSSFKNIKNDYFKEIYYLSDSGYDSVSKKIDNPNYGSCHKLSKLCNNKYNCREVMTTLKDIPFKKCIDGYIKWENKDEKLIAKPVNGTGSKDLFIVKDGDKINIGKNQTYIVEKYIDDKFPKVSVDGFICGDKIDILSIWDNIYHEDEPTKLYGLSFPSKYSECQFLKNKYIEVVKELKEKTNCNNQVIDIEFFIVNNEAYVMEINPRIGGNYLPIYHVTGYNPFTVNESLQNNKIPEKSSKTGLGYCRYNYGIQNMKDNVIRRGKNIFSIYTEKYYHTYVYSYDKNEKLKNLKYFADNEFKRININMSYNIEN
jgi:predicted ATP-grasp superfamily ATP-dependent carboligase